MMAKMTELSNSCWDRDLSQDDMTRSIPFPRQPEDTRKMNELVQAFLNKRYLRARAVLLLKKRKITSGVRVSELMDAGKDGFLDAYRNYDPDYGVLFTTYAIKYVDHAMSEYLKENYRRMWTVSLDTQSDDLDDEEAGIQEQELLGEAGEAVMDLHGRKEEYYHDSAENCCIRKMERDDMLHAISLLEEPNARFMYYRYYQSPQLQRWESARHFEISDELAKELELESLEELKKYYYLKKAKTYILL